MAALVSKVHIEAERHHYSSGLQIVMIGHAGHPETIGTMGQLFSRGCSSLWKPLKTWRICR